MTAERIKKSISNLIHDPVISKRIYALTLAAALFILVLVIKGPEEQGRLLTDSSGNVTGIRRHTMNSTERYDVTVTVGEEGESFERDVTIGLRGTALDRNRGVPDSDNEDRREAEIDAEIDRMLNDLEYSEDETIDLPDALSDGTPVRWRARKQQDRTGLIIVPFMYIALRPKHLKAMQ